MEQTAIKHTKGNAVIQFELTYEIQKLHISIHNIGKKKCVLGSNDNQFTNMNKEVTCK